MSKTRTHAKNSSSLRFSKYQTPATTTGTTAYYPSSVPLTIDRVSKSIKPPNPREMLSENHSPCAYSPWEERRDVSEERQVCSRLWARLPPAPPLSHPTTLLVSAVPSPGTSAPGWPWGCFSRHRASRKQGRRVSGKSRRRRRSSPCSSRRGEAGAGSWSSPFQFLTRCWLPSSDGLDCFPSLESFLPLALLSSIPSVQLKQVREGQKKGRSSKRPGTAWQFICRCLAA